MKEPIEPCGLGAILIERRSKIMFMLFLAIVGAIAFYFCYRDF